MEADNYSKELDVAVRVVHLACSLCMKVQEGLVSTSSGHVKANDDDSPVTVAGTEFDFLNLFRFRHGYALIWMFGVRIVGILGYG